jgi:CYTH domain-containing protein
LIIRQEKEKKTTVLQTLIKGKNKIQVRVLIQNQKAKHQKKKTVEITRQEVVMM